MEYRIDMPRKTYDGLCAFLQMWRDIYSQPGAVLFKGTFRDYSQQVAGATLEDMDGMTAEEVAQSYDRALHTLGRCKVRKNDTVLDLRDLDEDDIEALLFVYRVAKLKPQQTKVMYRTKRELDAYLALPAMVRIAMAAEA